jgi:hypothetical protein
VDARRLREIYLLDRVTANALRVKNAWRFTLGHPKAPTRAAAEIWADTETCAPRSSCAAHSARA